MNHLAQVGADVEDLEGDDPGEDTHDREAVPKPWEQSGLRKAILSILFCLGITGGVLAYFFFILAAWLTLGRM